MKLKANWYEKNAIKYLKEHGIKAKKDVFNFVRFTLQDFTVSIKENDEWHKSVFSSTLDEEQSKDIQELQKNYPNYYKKHFREIEKTFDDGKMLFRYYYSATSEFHEITLIDYLEDDLFEKSNDEILKDAQSLSALFGGETIFESDGKFFGYTYTQPYAQLFLNFLDPNFQDLKNIIFLSRWANKGDNTFIIGNPAQLAKRNLNNIERKMIDFVRLYLFYIKQTIVQELKQFAKKEGMDKVWQKEDTLKSEISKKASKWIYFLMTTLKCFVMTLPNVKTQNDFISKLDEDVRGFVGLDHRSKDTKEMFNEYFTFIKPIFVMTEILTEKTWDDFISNLKKEVNDKKDEENEFETKPKLK